MTTMDLARDQLEQSHPIGGLDQPGKIEIFRSRPQFHHCFVYGHNSDCILNPLIIHYRAALLPSGSFRGRIFIHHTSP